MADRFQLRKNGILDLLTQPEDEYSDLSPKGSVDERIRSLVDLVNSTAGFVTTSSCSGRIAVYLEGPIRVRPTSPTENDDEASNDSKPRDKASTSSGGKGGGKWLFATHDPVDFECSWTPGMIYQWLGFEAEVEPSYPQHYEHTRYVHFKFEPMILHILTASAKQAQVALNAAMAAGFRESGISSLFDSKGRPTNPMVAVRSSGMAMDSVVGFHCDDNSADRVCPMVSEDYLRTLIQVANGRFKINMQRMERFRMAFLRQVGGRKSSGQDGKPEESQSWEAADARKERKRREGLLRKDALRAFKASNEVGDPQSERVGDDTGAYNLDFDDITANF